MTFNFQAWLKAFNRISLNYARKNNYYVPPNYEEECAKLIGKTLREVFDHHQHKYVPITPELIVNAYHDDDWGCFWINGKHMVGYIQAYGIHGKGPKE